MTARKWLLGFAVIFVSLKTWADVQYLRLARGKVVAYEYIEQNASGAALVLLPGVNRSLTPQDSSVRLLAQQGWNILMPSFSAHPLSIAGLDKNEIPYFTFDTNTRSAQFAEEVQALVQFLGIKKALPVTLSYSSSVGAYLNASLFPHVIETVPLGTALEADPEAARNSQLWENWLRLNPFMAPFWIRQFRDQAYTLHWSQTVDANLRRDPEFYGESPRVSDIKAGYVTIARAVEDFNFPAWDFRSEKRTRDFVLAGKENPERLKNQMEVLRRYIATGRPVRVVVVAPAGHILPTNQPEVYAGVVGLLARESRGEGVRFAVINSAENLKSVRWQSREALDQWIKENQH